MAFAARMTELGGSGRGEVGGIACEIRLGGQGGGGQGCGGRGGGGGVGEEVQGVEQTIGADGAVKGVREVAAGGDVCGGGAERPTEGTGWS